MKTFDIGPGLRCDLDALLNTRLLVQANSGAGKSWALRRLLEQTSGQVQHLVIDPEGEFATLRERFDYVLAARHGGETLADPRTAKLLAERLLELGVSAVLDIYELKAHERIRFVRAFLEALVEAPKALWHPVLVVLDEAHVYAPQQGEAESAGPVIDLCTRGRKRGFCAVLATQRLSKLHKDAAAECNNKLIGRSALDVDMQRAAYELGFTSREQQQTLRALAAGEFYAFGPALTTTVAKVTVGPVQTSHPKAGSRLAGVVPPPTDKVRAVLSKLADLPAEAEARERTVTDLKRENTDLKRQLTQAQKAAPAREVITETKAVLLDTDRELLGKLAQAVTERTKHARENMQAAESRVDRLVQTAVAEYLNTVRAVAMEVGAEMEKTLERVGLRKVLDKLEGVTIAPPKGDTRPGVPTFQSSRVQAPRVAPRPIAADASDLSPAELRMLDVIASAPAGVDRTVLALASGYSVNGGGFRNTLSALNTTGLIEKVPSGIALSTAGVEHYRGEYVDALTAAQIGDIWRGKLSPAEWRMLEVLINAGHDGLSRRELAERANYDVNGGGFRNTLSALNTNALIVKWQGGIAAHGVFLEDVLIG